MADTSDVSSEDRALLAGFIRSTRELLAQIVKMGGVFPGEAFVPADIMPALSEAWPPVELQLLVMENVTSTVEDQRMIEHGLYGPQLTFKLAVIERIRQRFFANPTKRWLQRWLKAIDNLLDSLPDPLGVGAAIKEFKTAIEDLAEEAAANDGD